jgi:L-cysteine desulfidase
MRFSDYLAAEWRVALGCTEPAAIALAACLAARQADGALREVCLRCDPRVYKNCYAVGIPGTDGKLGILWAAALGAALPDPSAELEIFRQVDRAALAEAEGLLAAGAVRVEVAAERRELFIDCRVLRTGGRGRAVLEREHSRLVRLERDGLPLPVSAEDPTAGPRDMRAECVALDFDELIALARALSPEDRASLGRGIELNQAIARHGLGLFPRSFVDMAREDPLTRISRLVCAGVYARMLGEDLPVMTLAGSGNKGITCAVPLSLWAEEAGQSAERTAEALALACLVTSAATHHLGTLSAACGCSNAAGIGLAVGLCHLEGGDPEAMSLAIHNMVGNVTGMICDGAKIGCALKTMTAVDAAFRAARLALSGVGIPPSDGVVGRDGQESLRNLGRIATRGMLSTDAEILAIMQEKLERSDPG